MVDPLQPPSPSYTRLGTSPRSPHPGFNGHYLRLVEGAGYVGEGRFANGLADPSPTPSLTKSTRATVTAYTLRVARMLLKVSLGAVAAVVGILFLNAGFVPGFAALDSQVQILAYAIVFGASQQVVTRLAGQQGERLLKSASAEN